MNSQFRQLVGRQGKRCFQRDPTTLFLILQLMKKLTNKQTKNNNKKTQKTERISALTKIICTRSWQSRAWTGIFILKDHDSCQNDTFYKTDSSRTHTTTQELNIILINIAIGFSFLLLCTFPLYIFYMLGFACDHL